MVGRQAISVKSLFKWTIRITLNVWYVVLARSLSLLLLSGVSQVSISSWYRKIGQRSCPRSAIPSGGSSVTIADDSHGSEVDFAVQAGPSVEQRVRPHELAAIGCEAHLNFLPTEIFNLFLKARKWYSAWCRPSSLLQVGWI